MATGDDVLQNQVMVDLEYSTIINAPLEAVWGEITRRRGIQRPMFNTVLETTFERGSRILYRSENGKRVFIIGEVVELQSSRRLVHTFRFTTVDEDPTLVTWELTEAGDGCRVSVTHSHFSNQAATYKSVLTAWPAILANYKSVLESGNVPHRTRLKHGLMQAFAFMMPSATRTQAAILLPTALSPER